MSVRSALTAEQKRELVYAYVGQPYGCKRVFLQQRGVSRHELRVWRAQVLAESLDTGLVPRGGVSVSAEEVAGLARLAREKRELEDRLQTERAEHVRALAAKDAELAIQRRAVDALGKAIEILHQVGASKNSQDDGAEGRLA